MTYITPGSLPATPRPTMTFRKLIYLTVLAVSFTASEAMDICAYTSRLCGGSFGCCTDIPVNTCCWWEQKSGYGWSVRFKNTGPNWFGSSYGGRCAVSTGGVGSNLPDNTCLSVFDAPNYLNWASANWRRDFPNGASAAPRSDEGGCRMPDVLGYTDSDGNQRMYKVPVERFDEALGAIEAEDYSALGEFEEVTSTVSD